MSFRVRSSKFRHVYGQTLKKEQCYDNVRVSKSSWDSTFCAVNPKFLAVIVECGGGGGFIVIPLKQTGRQAPDAPIVGGHKGAVLDIAWDPFNDNVIASASEDCLVKVWHIPDYGLTRTLQEPIVELEYHQRRVGLIVWHPSAANVLLTAGGDNLLLIWDVSCANSAAAPLVVIDSITEPVWSASWSWNGSQLLLACRDKKIRLMDPRTGEVTEEATAHEGAKCVRGIFLKNGLVLTTGFSRRSERQYSLRAPGHLADPIVMVDLDRTNGVLFPLYDADTNMVYLCGKGDSVIRYFEITPEPPFVHYINTFMAHDPQRAIGMLPKRGCDVQACEIARLYRVNNNGLVSVHPFVVPRKSELFQEDLYPDTVSDVAAITADDWVSGTNADPVLISMKSVHAGKTSKKEAKKPAVRKPSSSSSSSASDKRANTTTTSQHNNNNNNGGAGDDQADALAAGENVTSDAVKQMVADAVQVALKSQEKRFDELHMEIRKMKAVIVRHDDRIQKLEAQLKQADVGEAETAAALSNPSSLPTAAVSDSNGVTDSRRKSVDNEQDLGDDADHVA